MKYTTLGQTGLNVSRIAFGTWQLGGDWGRFDEDAAIAAVRRARELGVNFFDTAQAYGFGASEQILGEALRDELTAERDELVIATKGGLRQTDSGLVRDASPEWLRRGVDASLTALGVDHIDLYQVHWPDPSVSAAETAGALRELVCDGKIGHVGVSNYNAWQMAEFSATLPVETLQPPYHLFRREIEDGELPYCRAHNIGVLVYGPLAHGLLTGTLSTHTAFAADDWRSTSGVFQGGDFELNLATVRALAMFAADLGVTISQLAIAWTLANPSVHVAIVGARQAGHVQDSVAAADVSLSEADLDTIDTIMSFGAQVAGPSPEGM
ncbi:aldo/keto reductase [Mycobacterium parmense]|uniref:Oxidoreductase n=1 Tax=Mycobacterium parmense TaxID=185642 RepID=A0A7I7Z4S4_9MYCO|nr:aldo/keto reductase [Mycobacterium parmense]MCV7352365.1 aldo/keto reductase [Mycobacterium parmense]ORW56432.1 general stress protein [Mycobacterium parmense]BBZ47911.1 oxidoreductase [Mycobacterium parmense]